MNPEFATIELVSQLDINKMRPVAGFHANALLRQDDWRTIDDAVVKVARQNLTVLDDLARFGLVKPPAGLGLMFSSYEQQSELTTANVDMAADTRAEMSNLNHTTINIPVPIIHKEFSLNARVLMNSRMNRMEGLDVSHAESSARRVAEAIEDMIINGVTLTVNGSTIQGLTNATNRVTDTATNFGGGAWSTAGNAYKTINGMIAGIENKGFYGPYGVYVANNLWSKLRNLISTESGKSEMAALMENLGLATGGQVAYVKPSRSLAAGTAVLFQLTSDVIDIATGVGMTTVQWEEQGRLTSNFRVMAALAPRVKYDAGSNCGVAHATSAL
jgi:uncharacterized linocin/CFP29 family protein